jgi:Tol biopolymer transport system component
VPIQAGTRLGPYEVTAFIGAGGMGEVYRARDGRLHRDVAIKVLPEGVARDQESRSRFERETQAVAALSHPNVLAIYDTGTHDGRLFAVTELLDGQTLRERLRQGPVPVRKAVDWAVQTARGLAAAHDKQLVHRDIKPENIFLTADGRVKILDFGLAKAPVREADAAAETAADMTGAGVVLGTAGYMAPEQVRGQATDARTDLFAFGAVLYEMLSGVRAFRRETVAETMTAILHDDPPDLTRSRLDVPPALERIVRHCLEKQTQERFQTARDVAFALETLSAASSAPGGATTTADPGPRRSPAARVAIVAAVAFVVPALGWYLASKAGLLPGGSATTPVITIGSASQVTTDDGLEIDAALSPDGKLLAYSAGQATGMRIYIRPVAGGRTLTLSEGGTPVEFQPRWSPDGSQILFLTPDGVFVASALGGASQRIAGGGPIGSAAWAPDGKRVAVGRPSGLSVVAPDGRAERVLTEAPELHSCVWSPLDDWIACVSGNIFGAIPGLNFGNVAPSGIVLIPAQGGPPTTVADRTAANFAPAFSADGRHLYFVSNRSGPRDIYVMDLRGGVATPPPVTRVTTGLGVHSMSFDARNQRLAYVAYSARANIWSMPIPTGAAVDTSGAKAITTGSQIVESTRVSPDGKWLVFDSTLHLNADIFRMPLSGGPAERLTTDSADEFAGDLSPDGREITYHSWRSGSRDIEVKAIGGGPPQAISNSPAQESYPRWSPDGSRIAFVDQAGLTSRTGRGRLFVVRRDATRGWSAPVVISDQTTTGQVAWLSDQRIALTTARGIESASVEPGPSELLSALNVGAGDPEARTLVLSEDGRSLYFKSRDADGRSSIWILPVTGGRPRLLVRFADPARPSIRGDFGAGAGRFFFTIEDRQADIWVAEVGKR